MFLIQNIHSHQWSTHGHRAPGATDTYPHSTTSRNTLNRNAQPSRSISSHIGNDLTKKKYKGGHFNHKKYRKADSIIAFIFKIFWIWNPFNCSFIFICNFIPAIVPKFSPRFFFVFFKKSNGFIQPWLKHLQLKMSACFHTQ